MIKKKKKVRQDSIQDTQNPEHDEKVVAESVVSDAIPEPEGRSDAGSNESLIEIEELRAEVEEVRDKFVRAKAETENVRRRAETDVVNARKFAIEKFAAEMLMVRDSLELARTVDLGEDNHDALKKMHEGLDLTLKQMDAVFEKFQMAMVDPDGEKFNPDLHQAISLIESPEVAANHVVSVVQKGCTISERLLRPAMVVVSKGNEGQEDGKKDQNGQKSEENEVNSS